MQYNPATGEENGRWRVVTDIRGSVVALINLSNGNLDQRREYGPWGELLGDDTVSGAPNHPFGFAGGVWDADTGLLRFGARDYDPTIGRWTARDPIGFAGGDANLYAYVGGDPVGLVDPTGLAVPRWVRWGGRTSVWGAFGGVVLDAFRLNGLKDHASEMSDSLFGSYHDADRDPDSHDAFRHCYASCVGVESEIVPGSTRFSGWLWEAAHPNNSQASSEQDHHNNRCGREIASGGEDGCVEGCLAALRSGTLVTGNN